MCASIETERRATADMGMSGPTSKPGAWHSRRTGHAPNLIGNVFSSKHGATLASTRPVYEASRPGNDQLFQQDRPCERRHESSEGDG